jgi:HD-like signal output (HDOD) protein
MTQLGSLEQQALESVAEGFRLNALKLPTLPEVTAKVRAIAADPDAGVEDLAREIMRDAGLTARLMRIANSPLLRGRMEVRTLTQAITRLGFFYVRDLVTALALEHTFEPRSATTRQLHLEISRRSKDVAAVSQVLARHCTSLPPEQALLAGLMHYIGALPLLAAMDEAGARADLASVSELIEMLHAEVGAQILRHWRFPEDIAAVPMAYRDTARAGEVVDYADIVAVACLLARPLGAAAEQDWEEFPPARRLGLNQPAEFHDDEAMQIDLQQSRGILS